MIVLYTFIVMALLSLLMITLTAAWEKRLVWPYVSASIMPPGQLPEPTAYTNAASMDASEAEFSWLGTYADGKGMLYRLRYDFFLSPGHDVLALVGNGSVASIPTQTTWLITLLDDDRYLVTLDSQTGGELDLAGLMDEALVERTRFAVLLSRHCQRLSAVTATVVPFSAADPLATYHAYRQHRVEHLVLLGYASFLDAEQTGWRYSLKGALTLAFRQYFTALRRSFIPDKVRSARPST